MNKLLFSASLLALTASAARASSSEPACIWAELLTSLPGHDNCRAISLAGNDRIYWMCTEGSNSSDKDVFFGPTYLFDGASYDGTSSNKNLLILATDSNGIPDLEIYSQTGDFSNDGGIAVDKDGNLIFAVTARHTDGATDHPLHFESYNWQKYDVSELNWTVSSRYMRLVLGSVAPDGNFNWLKSFAISTTPMPDATTATNKEQTSNAITCNGVTVDNEGNIYVCGNFRKELIFPVRSGKDVILTPHNTAGWNGDSQKTVGDLFVVKLDSDGYFLAGLTQESGEISAASAQQLVWNDGKLYVFGFLTGNGTDEATIAAHTFVPSSSVCPLVGCFDSNLNAEWLECLPGAPVGGRNAVQNVGMKVFDGAVWLAGQFNGRISSATNPELYVESTQGTMREGFVIKLNATDGSWLASTGSRADYPENVLTGYLDVIHSDSDPSRIFVYGYGMNANVGVFLRGYDAADLSAIEGQAWPLVTEGGVPTACAAAFDAHSNALYISARGNKAFNMAGKGTTANPGGYSNVMARFDIPDNVIAGVENVVAEAAEDGISITPASGGVVMANASGRSQWLSIHNLLGAVVWSGTVHSCSELLVSLAPGVYVSSQKTKFVVQ